MSCNVTWLNEELKAELNSRSTTAISKGEASWSSGLMEQSEWVRPGQSETVFWSSGALDGSRSIKLNQG